MDAGEGAVAAAGEHAQPRRRPQRRRISAEANRQVVLACSSDDGGASWVAGQKMVLLPQYGGSEVTIDDEDLVLFRDDDIMGILKD